MSFRLFRLLYNLLFPFLFAAMLPAYLARMLRRGGFREAFGQRFARYRPGVAARLREGPRTWIHAVSVGEVLIGLKLARKLREIDPSFRAVLSTTTTTGRALALREAPDWIETIYHPVDLPGVAARAMALIRPERLVLIEAEIWPNLVAAAKRLGVPVALANARLSPRSERRFLFFRPLVAPLFGALDAVCVQEPCDAGRFARLGVPPGKIDLTGSIKFDGEGASPPRPEKTGCRELLASLGVSPDAPVLLGGSTFPGEEGILARAAAALEREFPGLFLVAVPRHAERAAGAVAEIAAAGLRATRKTAPEPGARALVVDTTGELRDWYAAATVVFVGKSLAARGGQNPVEPIAAGKPVLFGPHMENFRPLAGALVRAGGAVEVGSEEELVAAARRLLASPEERERMAAEGARAVETHRGATGRTARLLLGLRNRRET